MKQARIEIEAKAMTDAIAYKLYKCGYSVEAIVDNKDKRYMPFISDYVGAKNCKTIEEATEAQKIMSEFLFANGVYDEAYFIIIDID